MQPAIGHGFTWGRRSRNEMKKPITSTCTSTTTSTCTSTTTSTCTSTTTSTSRVSRGHSSWTLTWSCTWTDVATVLGKNRFLNAKDLPASSTDTADLHGKTGEDPRYPRESVCNSE